MAGSNLEIFDRLSELSELSVRGDEFLPDEISSFLQKSFDLKAVVLFKFDLNNSLEVLGKSPGARRAFFKGATFHCKECNLNSQESAALHSDPACALQISDDNLLESCLNFKCNGSPHLLIKISLKKAFQESEKNLFRKTVLLSGIILSNWLSNRESLSFTDNSLSKILTDSLNELRTGTNAIIGNTTIITNEKLNTQQIESVTSIKRAAQNILLYLNDLGELSKIELNNISKNVKRVELVNFTEEIVGIFKNRAGDKKLEYTISVDDKLKDPVIIDEQKLRYILTTILFISSTLTEKGQIAISAAPLPDKKFRFSISDTGKPLSDSTVQNIFEPFVISNLEEFKNSPISGLILTVVKKYVTYLGGEINISSTAGRGNSFIFTIAGELMSNLENSISQLPKPTTKNRVLVIEDDYATSKLLNNYLTKWGYDPKIVSSEEEAFTIINSEKLLAVILDIELPNLNGLELLKKIHDHPNVKNTPVIVCSVEPEQQKAFLMGAVEYFIKPINYNYLVEVLTNYKLRKNSNVLCVDDDVPTLNLVKQAIESAGFNPIAENISANVMNLIKDKDIDLAIVDLDMPAPNGFELIKLIKSEKKFSNLPIIIYTGKENYKEDLKKIEGLFEELLDKRSTNIEDLADTINLMINRYETPPPASEVIAKDNVLKILLAEDYKHSQIIVTRLLKKNSFENIVVVENGEEAVKMATEEKFDLILMDMQMPVMNGFEATEKIREMPEYKYTPIIALTAFAMKGDREKCLEAGATDYIPKPIDSKEFIEKVKYYTNTLG